MMVYQRQFIVGKTYRRVDGKAVKIIAEQLELGPHYLCVQGDDGKDRWEIFDEFDDPRITGKNEVYGLIPANAQGWRYDRASDPGRCTGSKPGDVRNLLPGAIDD